MGENLAFTMVLPDDVEALKQASTKEQLQEILSAAFTENLYYSLLANHSEDKKSHLLQVFMDYLIRIASAATHAFTEAEKISLCIQLGYEIPLRSFCEHLGKSQSIDMMCNLINSHSAHDPPSRFMVFSLEDVKTVSALIVEAFYFRYDIFYKLFATNQMASFKWGAITAGRFPVTLDLQYGNPVEDPEDIPIIKELYFTIEGDAELDELDLEELMKGSQV